MDDSTVEIAAGITTVPTTEYFNRVIGQIEDVVVGPEFQAFQHAFMEKYYERFDDATEENSMEYFDIFAEYSETMEAFITTALQKCNGVDMERFVAELSSFTGQLDGEIFDLLFSLSDFVKFKEMILDYKAYKSGAVPDVGASIVVQSLKSAPDVSDAQTPEMEE